jgi:hypothetical protein
MAARSNEQDSFISITVSPRVERLKLTVGGPAHKYRIATHGSLRE